jgi:hypothetical protein
LRFAALSGAGSTLKLLGFRDWDRVHVGNVNVVGLCLQEYLKILIL